MKKLQNGVTLIELLITVMIIGILTAIAVPSYRQYVIRANRSDAKVALTGAATTLERCYTRYSKYKSDDCATGLPKYTDAGTYQIKFVTGEPTDTTFVVEAVPQQGQAKDTRCGTFRLNQRNKKTVSASADDARVNECWGR